MALKRPNAVSFSKKNAVRPFEDASSLEFWAQKNDASLFVVGQSTKKRPDGLTFVRMYDCRVLDMCEVGVDGWKSMADFKVRPQPDCLTSPPLTVFLRAQTPKATPGHKPLLHFASELFDSHPRYVQLKSMLMDFFNGEVIDSIHLKGIEHVVSVSLAPTPPTLNAATATLQASTSTAAPSSSETLASLPKVHVRAYTIRLLASGTRVPRVELTPMGPSLDLTLRRHTEADPELWKQAMRRPKARKQDVEKGLGRRRKNMEVDEMGDLRGRIHVGRQDLAKLQTRKMKGLKPGRDEGPVGGEDEDGFGSGGEGDGGRPRKRARAA